MRYLYGQQSPDLWHSVDLKSNKSIQTGTKGIWYISISMVSYYYFETPKYCFSSESYDEALAGLLVSIWKELSEVEREEIRKLLREWFLLAF